MSEEFAGKVVLVTGAASGLGRATALKLSAAGATLALTDLNHTGLSDTEALIAERTAPVFTVDGDISEPANCARVVAATLARFGRLDVLLNIAGVLDFHRLAQVTPADWNRLLACNLTAPFFMIQSAMPHLIAAKGNVVNVASTASFLGQAYTAPYAATKAGVLSLTRSLAMEFVHEPVRINAVAPGGMKTPLALTARFGDDMDQSLIYRYAGLRSMTEPEDVAEVILFLASDRARAIHGACYLVDQGTTAG
ncbi:MAG: SDR family oxidoreductase [Gammaproteobacteria bacterium]|nr:SDR family oxidoreductase [Gammaproteobacteria bacterium]